jgi:uncharacterized protein YecE (DUF72 family)
MAQLGLFGDEPVALERGAVAPAVVADDIRLISAQIPATVRFGTSSWSFPGWRGLVWGDNVAAGARGPQFSEAVLAKKGLAAYAQHPLLRTVGVDRTHYAPVTANVLADYAATVPDHFRFLCKAHEACTLATFPGHPRYGELRNRPSPHFLDASYARDMVVAPFVEGFGAKAGTLLFQFAAQSIEQLGGSPRKFAERLYRFLRDLPPLTTGRDGSTARPYYAVEIRQASLLTSDYAAALKSAGAVHCFNVLPGMPALSNQRSAVGEQPTTVIRWMLAPHHSYETALEAYGDFSRLVDPDPNARRQIADMVRGAVTRKHDAMVIVNNKAEGSSPLSIVELARELRNELQDQPPF